MDRDLQNKLNSISRRSLEGLLNDILKRHNVSFKKPNLSSAEVKELRSLVKDLEDAVSKLTKSETK